MKTLLQAIRMLLVMTVILGLGYPLVVTILGSTLFPKQAGGSLLIENGRVLGSELISQKFEQARYFHPRPSAGDFNPLPSGGTNLGPTAQKLQATISRARKALGPNAPSDLLYSSGSGLDPHISPESARFQLVQVAQARGFNDQQRVKLEALVSKMTSPRDLGFLGESSVNVLTLNLAVDKL